MFSDRKPCNWHKGNRTWFQTNNDDKPKNIKNQFTEAKEQQPQIGNDKH